MADLGHDLSCINDLSPDMAETSGRLVLAQGIARRLSTPRARLLDDPNYGFDLTQYVNDDLTKADIGRIQAGAQAECLKDERVLAAVVTIIVTAEGALVATVVLQDGEGPFTLVLAVSAVTVSLLTVPR
jgi:phage baseplate assembly protein W